MKTLVGPFSQILTMDHLPECGPLKDTQLDLIPEGGIIVEDGWITAVGTFQDLNKNEIKITPIPGKTVALPGFIDAHTHICFAGSRAHDYALRLDGATYQEIALQGGGIHYTARLTHETSREKLLTSLLERLDLMLTWGVTTAEIKSGYSLTLDDEIKLLEVIHQASQQHRISIIPTCLAAHTLPPHYPSKSAYLRAIQENLFPVLREKNLSKRLDIFIDTSAFSVEEARPFIQNARSQGFEVTIHADQFSRGAALLAAELGVLSADHLEASTQEDFIALKKAHVIPIVLPGSSLGLGTPFAKGREMLDHGLSLVIASDWNPGSAPMGNLLVQAALFGANQRLSLAETFAALTIRAAKALNLHDRGAIKVGFRADIVTFPCASYQEILYNQGLLKPTIVPF